MKRITVVDGHPDPLQAHLDHALADAYARSARAAGHEVRRINVADIDFPLLRKTEDFYNRSAPESIRNAQRDIAWADHIAFFYPLWHGTMPALLKAFIEQTFRPGFSMDYGGKGRFPKPLFRGKSARVVVTMGMPAFIYRTYFGAYGVRGFERSILSICGVAPVHETLLGGAFGHCESRAEKWIDLMERLAKSDADPLAWRRQRLLRRTVRALIVLGLSYAAYLLAASTSSSWFRGSSDREDERESFAEIFTGAPPETLPTTELRVE